MEAAENDRRNIDGICHQLEVERREKDQLRTQIRDQDLVLVNAKTHETRAIGEADNLAQEARAARGDVSFLSKEAQRLNEELRLQVEEKHRMQDQLARLEVLLDE